MLLSRHRSCSNRRAPAALIAARHATVFVAARRAAVELPLSCQCATAFALPLRRRRVGNPLQLCSPSTLCRHSASPQRARPRQGDVQQEEAKLEEDVTPMLAPENKTVL